MNRPTEGCTYCGSDEHSTTDCRWRGQLAVSEVIEEDKASTMPTSVVQVDPIGLGREQLLATIRQQGQQIDIQQRLLFERERELAALKAQSGGLVLPERKSYEESFSVHGQGQVMGWNACREEVARLNACQVSDGGADERAAFEAWVKTFNSMPAALFQDDQDERESYLDDWIQCRWIGWQARAALAGRDAVPDHSEQVRDGWVQVPKSMLLEANSLEALVFVGGGITGDDGAPTYLDCVLWVGDLLDDDGRAIHGLHAYCTECEEEGSTTLAEFAAAPSAHPQGGE